MQRSARGRVQTDLEQLALAIAAYKVAITALAKGGWLTSTQASSLTTLVDNLTLT